MKVKTIQELKIAHSKNGFILKREKTEIKSKVLDATKPIVKLLRKIIPKEEIPVQEQAVAIFTNMDNEAISFVRVGKGAIEGVVFDIKNIAFCAVHERATGFVMCHTHPTDDLRPSGEDIESTWKFHAIATVLGITYIDDIILGPEKELSLEETGII